MDIYYIYLKLVRETLLLFIFSSALLRLLDKYFLMFSKKLSTAHIHRSDRVRGSYQGSSKFCDRRFINLRTLLHLHFLQHAQNYATFQVYCTLRLGITFKLLINIGQMIRMYMIQCRLAYSKLCNHSSRDMLIKLIL